MTYDLSQLENASSVYDVSMTANSVTSGYYGIITILCLYIIVFVVAKQSRSTDVKGAFLTSAWITFVVGFIFFLVRFITGDWLLIICVILFMALIMNKLNRGG